MGMRLRDTKAKGVVFGIGSLLKFHRGCFEFSTV